MDSSSFYIIIDTHNFLHTHINSFIQSPNHLCTPHYYAHVFIIKFILITTLIIIILKFINTHSLITTLINLLMHSGSHLSTLPHSPVHSSTLYYHSSPSTKRRLCSCTHQCTQTVNTTLVRSSCTPDTFPSKHTSLTLTQILFFIFTV